MAPQNSTESGHQVVSLPPELRRAHSTKSPCSKVTNEYENDQTETQRTFRSNKGEAASRRPPPCSEAETMVEVNGRERLKRHRVEVAGRVWIPDIWGQEELLKDWIDCTVFDASLVNSNIMSARKALVGEGRIRANSSGLSRC